MSPGAMQRPINPRWLGVRWALRRVRAEIMIGYECGRRDVVIFLTDNGKTPSTLNNSVSGTMMMNFGYIERSLRGCAREAASRGVK